ncbi:MAG: lytic transglycosylase domain-containing protein [Oligoflexia bacterium]|nr:lytic transglycosylase domain-containing protein [Oligoflexia bacterium]
MDGGFVELRLLAPSGIVPAGRLIHSGSAAPIRPSLSACRIRPIHARRRHHRLSGFSLFVLASSSSVIIAVLGLFLHSTYAPTPEIFERVASMDWADWAPTLGSGRSAKRSLLTDPGAARQVHFVSQIISSKYKRLDARDLALTIVSESYKANVDPLLVAAVISSESSFQRHVESHKGAVGLMQLLPETGRYISAKLDSAWHGSWKLREPEYNIKLGIGYLQYLKKMFNGNLEHALIAYNWGPGNLQQALEARSHIPSSTKEYARTILWNHKRWKSDFDARRAETFDLNRSVG